ncbi:hypothetical protein COY32_06955 [candidate division WWE3 bacterium CG_4_10_14_0_2_um_filter_41_14]|uniref:Transposase IS200-like domain-containing protein n=1 Tax=candidate division WWE3 bacterium CG_4_10_14_0_2_um_filter_41_14 TaxID=1975072 RepID=A0A2M7TEP2_UNCKA|nr:MAG: hypothetical protein COY32_06955 [candidate division WWE3 bacterium CG_4_10_14_0_2_um_filter_41_14]
MFGTVSVGAGSSRPEITLNNVGEIVNDWWYKIPEHFKNVRLDEWQITPNHVHGIIQINTDCRRENLAPTKITCPY